MPSLAGTLDALRPLLPPALVSAAAFGRACSAVAHLQPQITDGIYFECRLHDRSSRVDLVIIVRREGAALLSAPVSNATRGVRPEHPEWRRLGAFLRRWTAPGSSLHELIEHIWLEYDVEPPRPGSEASRPAPGVFCRLRAPRRTAHSAHELGRRMLTVVEALAGRPVSRIVRNCLSLGVALLPSEAAVPYVGLMIGRPVPTIRLCIAKLPAADAATYLAATAAVGGHQVADVTSQATLPDGAGGPWYVPLLHLDIDERRGFLPRVGLERPFPQFCQLAGKTGAREREFLEALTAQGLCARDKRDALLAWPGRSAAMLPHRLGWSVVERRINHVKFVQDPDCLTEIKGYLFARHYRRGERR